MCPLLESLNITQYRIQNLFYHNQRVNEARKELWPDLTPINLADIIPLDRVTSPSTYKCRILVGREHFQLEFQVYIPKPIKTLQLIHEDSIDYHLKWADRKSLTNLYQKRGDCDDILIVKNGWITDTYYCNVAFKNDQRWITPHLPLLKGTQRQYLLDHGRIQEAPIRVKDLSSFTEVKLFNALLNWDHAPTLSVKQIYP